MKEIVCVAGLLLNNFVANYHFKALVTIVTDVWGFKIFYAVIITNIQEGIKSLLIIIVAALADASIGDCWMLTLSAILYGTGLLIWHMGLPGPKDQTTPNVVFFFMSLVLITVGQCGSDIYYEKYVDAGDGHIQAEVVNHDEEEQDSERDSNELMTRAERIQSRLYSGRDSNESINRDEGIQSRCLFYSIRAWLEFKRYWVVIVGLPIAIFAIPNNGYQSFLLAMIFLCTTSCFIFGKIWYPFMKAQESPLVLVFWVVVAAHRKRHYDIHGTRRYYGRSGSITELNVINQVSELGGNNTNEYHESDHHESIAELENANNVDDEDNMDDNHFPYVPITDDHESIAELENANNVDDEDNMDDNLFPYVPITDESSKLEENVEDNNESENDNHVAHEVNVENTESENNHVNHEVNVEENSEPDKNYADHGVNIENFEQRARDHEDNINTSEPNLAANEYKLGFLDKAALYKESTNPNTEFENLRLFTVQQVEDSKCFFKLMLLSTLFLLYGVVTAVGGIFFIDQANNMDTHINSLELPIQLIAYTPDLVRKLVSWLCGWAVDKLGQANHHKFNGAVRVGLGMLLAVPCFLSAYLVETKRLHAADNKIKISVFWLIPQFFLIGAMDGLAKDGIEDFFEYEMPEAIGESYGSFLAEGVIGVGQLLGCLWFVFWYWVARLNANSDWFDDDTDKSHLNRYYFIMVVFSFVCAIIYVAVAAIWSHRHSRVIPETSPNMNV